jgi:DNA-binding Lrp family transcriptional regulator
MNIRKKYLFYILAFSSALLSSINAGVDLIVGKFFITNVWALGLSIFLIGIPVTLIIGLVFSLRINNRTIGARIIDPSFQRLRLIKKQEIVPQIIASFGNAVNTVGYFALLSLFEDPSIVLPFSQIVILYIVVVESISEKNMPTLSEIQSILIVTFGAILGSLTLTGSINVTGLFIVFLIINPGWMLLSIYQRKLKRMKIENRSNDSVNIRFWNVLFSTLITIGIIYIFDLVVGTTNLQLGFQASYDHFLPAAVISIGSFFALVLYIRSLGIGKASVVQAIRSSTIIFSIPVSLILSYFALIDPFSLDPTYLLIKFIGISIMVLGILSFSLNLVSAYIYITMKPGYSIEETMGTIWNIRGVTSIAATAGTYDFIVKIRTRALVKGYEKIIKKIEQIEGIDQFKWESILKEWEDI